MRRLFVHGSSLLILSFSSAAFAQNADDDAKLCGIDPLHSTFRRTHFAAGDITVTVPTDSDGNPKVSLDPGAVAAKIVASGKRESSIFPSREPFDPSASPTPVSVRVTCYPGDKRVMTQVPLEQAEAYPTEAKELAGHLSAPGMCRGGLAKELNDAVETRSNALPMATVSLSTVTVNGYRKTSTAYCTAGKEGTAQSIVSILVRDQLVCDKGERCWSS